MPRQGVAARQEWLRSVSYAVARDAHATASDLRGQGWSTESVSDALEGYASWFAEVIVDATTFGGEWYALTSSPTSATGEEPEGREQGGP
jgi:hypothetical protein